MKNLIITLGAMIYIITIIFFQVDLNEAIRYKKMLKNAADEAAATGAIFTDFNNYADGNQVFDYEKSLQEVKASLDYNIKNKAYNFLITFHDDSGFIRTYNEKNVQMDVQQSLENGSPYIRIILTGNIPRFRLNFINYEQRLKVHSSYEYLPY